MIHVARSLTVFFAALAPLVAACDRDLPERRWSSEHVNYFSRETDDSVCPDILMLLEEHGQTIADALGIERQVISYYKFDGLSDFDDNAQCRDGAGGCAPGAAVETAVSFHKHELVHAYLAHLGSPPWLLVEGAAVALACQRYPRPTETWQQALATEHGSPRLYGAGGWLVGHLLRSFPPASFVQLYRTVPRGAGATQLAAAFQSIYGVSLDEVWAAAVTAPQAPMWCAWECSRPVFAMDGQPHVLAPACGSGVHDLTFELPAAGVTRWQIEGGGRFDVASCDGHQQPAVVTGSSLGRGVLVAPLEAGRWFVHAVVDETGAPPQLAGSAGAALPFATTCAAAPDLPDDLASLSNLTLFYPGAGTDRFTRLAAGAGRRGSLLAASQAPGTIQLCDGCDGLTCAQAAVGESLDLAGVAAGAIVRVPAGAEMTARLFWF